LDLSAKKQLAWVNFKLERYPLGDQQLRVDRPIAGHGGCATTWPSPTPSRTRWTAPSSSPREVVRMNKENYKGVYCNWRTPTTSDRYESAIKRARRTRGRQHSACLTSAGAGLDKLGPTRTQFQCFEGAALDDRPLPRLRRRQLERQRRIVRLPPDEVEPTADPRAGNPDEEETHGRRRFDARCSVRP